MLSEQLKQDIQHAYRTFLGSRKLAPRVGQRLMLAEIARTLGAITLDANGVRSHSKPYISVVEAGTGTGKTVAYLLAVLPIAMQLKKKVVLSTGTVALQEQIIHKDLPDVVKHAELAIRYQLAKGRGRYLCVSKLDAILNEDEAETLPLYEDELSDITEADRQIYNEMMDAFFDESWIGDRDSWEHELAPSTWQRVTTDHRQCTGRKCSFVKQCPFFKARDEIEEVDLVVANHDLVLADLSLGGGAILPAPEESIYIFDEGHHLADKALNHFSANMRYKGMSRWLGQTEAQTPEWLDQFEDALTLHELLKPLGDELKAARLLLEEHLPTVQAICAEVDTQQAKFQAPRHRFTHGVIPPALERVAVSVKPLIVKLLARFEKVHDELEDLVESGNAPVEQTLLEKMLSVSGAAVSRLEGVISLLVSYAESSIKEGKPMARWITIYVDDLGIVRDYQLVASPVLAANTLDNALWSRACGAVVTSATLTALNSFDYFRYHTGTSNDNASYQIVPSPFDYEHAAIVVVPKDAVQANQADLHTQFLIDNLQQLFVKQKGTLCLFSSKRQMLEVFEALSDDAQACIWMQGDLSKQRLIEQHKTRVDSGQTSVIFGLASFAEGVDLPSDYCCHVIIAKLPFTVPDDPVKAGLAEHIKAGGGNDFMQLAVPEAAIKLVQAAGRLLRHEKDRGVITILDRRIVTKAYGKSLLKSLPPFSQDLAISVHDMPDLLEAWTAKDESIKSTEPV